MRYDKAIYFQTVEHGAYNPDTGDYADDHVTEVKKYGSVSDTGTDAMNLIYGSIKQGSLTTQLQTHYTETFHRIRVGRKVYRVDFERKLRTKHVFVVSEVQSGRN